MRWKEIVVLLLVNIFNFKVTHCHFLMKMNFPYSQSLKEKPELKKHRLFMFLKNCNVLVSYNLEKNYILSLGL